MKIKPSNKQKQLLAVIAVIMFAACGSTLAATDYWLGGVSSGNWSTGANWLSGNVPASFDALVFTNQSGAADTANNNFAAGTSFDGITFSNSSAGSTFSLTGNSIMLSGATNGVTLGITNSTALAETVSLSLTSDWGFYTFNSPAGSLSLNGGLTRSAGGVAYFGSGVQSTAFTTDSSGLISGLDGAGLMANGSFITGLATISGTTVSAYGYGGAGDQSLVAAATINSGVNDNVKLTPTATTTYTLAAGTTVYVNSILNVAASSLATVSPATGQTLVMGKIGLIGETMAGGTGTTKNMITIGGAGNLSAGGNTAGTGTLVFDVGGGNNTGNNIQITDTGGIVDNPAGGAVTVVVAGTGSMYINQNGTYSGGTYVCQGAYLQGNNEVAGPNTAKPFGTGPVYIAENSTLYPNVNGKATTAGAVTFANPMYLSPGLGYSGSLGAIKAGNETFSGTITLMGAPANGVAGAGDRMAQAVNTAVPPLIISGQITGAGTLEFNSQVATGNFMFSNTVASANNWTGGLIVDNTANNGSYVKIAANNQLAGNNVALIQSGTGVARLDLNGFNDTIGGLSGAANANNQVQNNGASASILTIGANNGGGSFGGVIANGSGLTLLKIGTGTETFSGANTYSGNTTILGGTLALSGSGSLSSSQITVSNATLDISGLSSSYTGSAVISITNGTFNLGTVPATAMGNLSITNTTLQFPVNPSFTNIIVAGTLLTAGTTNVINLTSVPGFGTYPQQVSLIAYSSFANVDANNDLTNLGVNLPALGGAMGYLTNNTAKNTIDIVLTSGPVPVVPITWNGKNGGILNGNWDILTSPVWVVTASPLTPYDYQDTSILTFDDTATGTTTVNITTTVLPGGITFNNTNKTYTFTGTGKISGLTGLTNNGAGTVILQEAGDTFSGGIDANSGKLIIDNNSSGISGGTTINTNGIVQIGNNDANGAPPAGAITNNGAVVFNRTDTALNLTALITGTGVLTNNGTGTVTLSAGGNAPATTVNTGILELNAGGAAGCISSNITVNPGAELDLNANDSLGYNTTLPPVLVYGTLKKLNNQAETLGRVITLSGGTMATTIAGAQQFESYNNYIESAAGTANFINGPGSFGLRTGSCYFTNDSGSTLTISCLIVTNQNNTPVPLTKWGTGTLIITTNNTYTGGTTINGGPLQVGTAADPAVLTNPLGYGYLNFAAQVTLNQGGVLNLASSKGVVISNTIADDNTGTLLVSSGTNTLTATNTYSGQTFVNAGALILRGSGSFNSTTNIVVANATLDLSQTTVAVNDGNCAFSLTNSTLNLGSNMIASASSLSVSNTTLYFPYTPNSINITVNNALVTGGTTNVINLISVPAVVAYPTNLTLIKYGSFANVDGGNNLTKLGLKLPTLGSPVGYLTNNVANNSIDLVLLSDTLLPILPITWTGRTNSVNTAVWDNLYTTDWVLTSDGVTPYKYQDGEPVLFDDTAAGPTTINLGITASPGGVTFNNTAKTYTVTGSGKIGGGTGVTNSGTGTVILQESGGDSYGGGITVNNGGTVILDNNSGAANGGVTISSGSLVQLGNNDANGTPPAGPIANAGALVFDRTDGALTVAGVISGGGGVTNNGTGTVTISAVETLTGPVVVNAGTLAVTNTLNTNPDGISQSSGLTINNGASVVVESDNALSGSTGTLPITINAGGTLTGTASSGTAGDAANAGTSSHIAGLLTLNGGTVGMQGPQSSLQSHGSWDLDNTITVPGNPTTSVMSALGLLPHQAGGLVLDVTNGATSGIDLLVSGSLIAGTAGGYGGSGIIKNGPGVMALDNTNNTFQGNTTINGGTLQVGMPGDAAVLASPLGAGTVAITNAGSILKFASSAGSTVTNTILDDSLSDALVLVAGGINTFTAANTYTAPTVVSNGTLVINGSLASASVVQVATHTGVLAGNGTIGGSVTNNGTMTPGTAGALGALTCSSSVVNNSGSTNVIKLNPALSPSNDVLTVTGNLTYGGTLKVVNLGGSYVAGETFKVFNAGGINGSFSATNLPSLGGGLGLSWNSGTATLTVIQTVNTTPTNLTASVSGGVLTLSWPADHTGWYLQVQTNSLHSGLGTNWADVPNSSTVNSENITINPANGAVFYRMSLNP